MHALRLQRSLRRVRSLNKRCFSAGDGPAPNDAANDALLFKEYEEKSSLVFLLSPEGMEQHIRNFDTSVISQVMLFNGLGVTWSLQNPLLKKYDFDADQFLQGAEQALREVTKAIVSREAYEYATDEAVKTCDPASFLSEVLFPHVYVNIMSNLRGNREESTNMTLPYRQLPNEVVIHKSYIVDVKAYPVDENLAALFKGQAEDLTAIAEGRGEILDGVPVMRQPGEEIPELSHWEKVTRDRIYRQVPLPGQDPATSPVLAVPEVPVGSILNRVRVRFECEFKYGQSPMSTAGGGTGAVKDDLSPPDDNSSSDEATVKAAREGEGAPGRKEEEEAVAATAAASATASTETGSETETVVRAEERGSPPPANNDNDFNSLPDDEKLALLQMGGMRTIEWDFAAVISGQTECSYKIANIIPQG